MRRLRHPKTRMITSASALLVLGLLPLGGGLTANAAEAPSTTTVYDATTSPLPPSMASQPFQAQQTSEFGDYVHLAGTNRVLNTVTVTMVTWALHSSYSTDARYMDNLDTWTHPVTVNVYSNHLDANGVPDTLLATKLENVSIPWRPVADPTCDNPTKWRAGDGSCNNGFAFNATFDLSSPSVTLPDDVIVGIAFNTQTYGAEPIGDTGPYNSLNVGAEWSATVGTDDNSDNVFWDTTYNSYTTGFREDTGWGSYGTVPMKITATPTLVAPPTSKDQCTKSGWMTFNNPSFKNQGDCVSFVATGGRNTANG